MLHPPGGSRELRLQPRRALWSDCFRRTAHNQSTEGETNMRQRPAVIAGHAVYRRAASSMVLLCTISRQACQGRLVQRWTRGEGSFSTGMASLESVEPSQVNGSGQASSCAYSGEVSSPFWFFSLGANSPG